MKKVVAAIVIVVIIVIAVVLAMQHSKTKTQSSTTASSSSSSKTTNTPTATDSVTISNFAFSPANILVKKGSVVTWTNQDSVAHTIQETDGQVGPKSSDVVPGKSYSFTFTSDGTFHYHCSIHPEMVGTVTVTE